MEPYGAMRVARVELDHFLCFRRLVLPIEQSLQILAGPNNAGKSSFVRALEAFFADPDGDELMRLQPAHEYFAQAGPRILSAITLWFDALSPEERTEAGGAVRRDGLVWVSVRCSRAGTVSYAASRGVTKDSARQLYEYVLSRHHFVKIPSVRVGGIDEDGRAGSLDRLLDTLEATLIRQTSRRSTSKQQLFSEKASAMEEVVREVLDESARSIHAELPFQEGEVRFRLPHFRYALRGMLEAAEIESVDGATVPVSQRGTGFQSALVLGILRYVADQERQGSGHVVFAVEEPEAFLHPQTQRAMAAILRGIADDAQLFVTTHSSVVVDSFRLPQIARLPLASDGTDFEWAPPQMSRAEEGRLTRYCDAANSELVFASAAVLVEGEGDKQVLEYLLDRLCQTPGGYYAKGVTVIDVGGKANFEHLVRLAENFNVRAFVLADKDALLAPDRHLLAALQARGDLLQHATLDAIRAAADAACPDYQAAREQQTGANQLLRPLGAFVWSSDLEGVLVDAFGVDPVLDSLGPAGEGTFVEQYCEQIRAEAEPETMLRRKLGSKGWSGSGSTTGKLKPHLPVAVIDRQLTVAPAPAEIRQVEDWLQDVLAHASTAAL